MRKILSFCLAILLFLAILSSCGSKTEKAEEQPVVVETNVPEPVKEAMPEPENADTVPEESQENETPADDEYSIVFKGIRPVAVMIDNQGSRVLPQGGLDKAQIVYEVIVEGGLTRLMPVFWGTEPEMIGPVRSARHYFLDFCMEYDAIYVHYGGSPQAGRDIKKLNVNEIDGLYLGTDVFWDLTKDPGNWQDSYTSMEKLKKYAEKKKFKDTTDAGFPLTYNETSSDIVPADGADAVNITLKYPSMTSSYVYDSITGTYKRFRYGKEHMERVSGKQLEAKNIIVMFVRNWNIKGDTAGRQDMDTTGSGTGYFITGGKAARLKWSKESRSSQTKYTYENGDPIVLNRGQTWIQVMPVNAGVTIE